MSKIPLIMVNAIMAVSISFAAQTIGNWTLAINQSGALTSMKLEHLKTQLDIESFIEIFLDNQWSPTRGHVVFRDGVERDLNFPEEVMTFWINYNGPHALWEYLASAEKVDMYNPDNALIPQQLYGRMTRVITKAGVEHIGKLVEFSNNPDWFILFIRGSSVPVYRHAVMVLEQLK